MKMLVHIVVAIVSTSLARVFRGPKRPTWSYSYEALLAILRRYNESPIGDVDDQRKRFDGTGQSEKTQKRMDVTETSCDGVKAFWVKTKQAPESKRVMLYFHGGAYVLGSPHSHMNWTGMLAKHNQLSVLSVDYRRAPEHPCPAAIDDAVTAYKWLLQTTSAEDIIIAGDSAGGGLTLAMLFALRDEGVALPKQAILFSPWVDLTMSLYKVEGLPAFDYLYVPGLKHSAKSYAGDLPLEDPRLSPLFGDFQGLPPILMQVGERELFVKEGKTLAYKLQEAGVDVAFVLGTDDIHVYPSFGSFSPNGLKAMEQVGEFFSGGVDAVSDKAPIEPPTSPEPVKEEDEDEDW